MATKKKRSKNPGGVKLPQDLEEKQKDSEVVEFKEMNPEFLALSDKRKRLISIITRDPSIPFREACIKAGFKVGEKAKVSIIKREIQGKLRESFRHAGVYESDIIQTLIEARKAVKYLKTTVVETKGESRKEFTRYIEVPDHAMRLKAAEKMAHLGDYFPSTKSEVLETHKHEITIFDGVPVEELIARRKALQEKGVEAKWEEVVEGNNDQNAA